MKYPYHSVAMPPQHSHLRLKGQRPSAHKPWLYLTALCLPVTSMLRGGD